MIDEAGGCGLTIRPRDTDHLRIGIASGKLYLADDVDAFLFDFDNHRSGIGDAGTFDDFVGIQNLLLCMMAFLPLNLVVVHQLLILVVDFRHVADEDLKALFLGQYCSSSTTFASS